MIFLLGIALTNVITLLQLHEIDDTVKESRSIVRSIKIKEFFTVTAPIIIYFLFKLVK